jgi:hypothetical protein
MEALRKELGHGQEAPEEVRRKMKEKPVRIRSGNLTKGVEEMIGHLARHRSAFSFKMKTTKRASCPSF